MRRPAPKREGKWTEIPTYMRKRVSKVKCQVCGDTYGTMRSGVPGFTMLRQNLDHLIPRRWLEARGINPHQTNNLLSVCGSCHGQKKTIEDRLFQGDAIGWLLGLRQIGYPVDQVVNFGISVGLEEFKRLVGVAAAR
jgi:HNH endonuclease